MNISIEIPSIRYFVRAYRAGEIILNQGSYAHSILLRPDAVASWRPEQLAAVELSDIEILIGYQPKLVLLGTGLKHRFPDPALLAPLYRAGIGVEVMATEAACRTYNLLADEGRHVLAALISH